MRSRLLSLLLAITMVLGISVPIAATEKKVQFVDVLETAYYYDEVIWGVENGIVSGFLEDRFEPLISCTRGQIATFIWRAEGKEKVANTKVTFKDVSKTSYYYDAIAWAVQKGIISGYSAETFGPEDTCTRAQLSTILYRLTEKQKDDNLKLSFLDVPVGTYYYDAVAWAVKEKIVNGYSDTEFGPNDMALRCDTVRILYGFYHLDKSDEVKPDITPEVIQEITPEVTPEVTPEMKPDKESEVDKAFPWDEEKAAEVVAVAKSYLDHADLFMYRAGYGAFDNTYMDAITGKYYIDCSTFIGLVLRGITYEESRYVTGNLRDVVARNDLYSWANLYLDRNGLRSAKDYAKYYYELGRTYNDINSVKPGDILFHWKDISEDYFSRVWHVSMVYSIDEDGTVTCVHSLSGRSDVGIWTFNIEDKLKNDGGYLFMARPDYSMVYEQEPVPKPIEGNLLVPSWESTDDIIKGVKYGVSEDGTSIITTGTATGGWSSFYYRAGSEPLTLEPGTYYLSGCPKRTDLDDNTKWSIHLYNTAGTIARDTGDGVVFIIKRKTDVYVCSTIKTGVNAGGYVWRPSLIKIE